MAKQVINIGTTANDGTGDTLRAGMDKVNDNFTELYPEVKSFTNASLDGSYDLIITTASCITFELTIYKPDGTHMLTPGLVEKTSSTQIKVHFGEPIIAGTWYYILKIYTTTT
jgi:hypothetical protein